MASAAWLTNAFTPLPLGSIKPQGWIRNQLQIQADGFTGHLEEHWEDVGPNNGWIGGKGESWERGPYYLDGLLPLAYLLQDERLINKATRWIEWALSSQQESGMFGPAHITTVNNDVNKSRDWWHLTIMLKTLTQYQEASGDGRVVPYLTKFFRYMKSVIDDMPLDGWARARGADLLLTVHWLYQRTSDDFLLELAATLQKQTLDWSALLSSFPFTRKYEGRFDHRSHVVNVAMGVKTPAVFYQLTGQAEHREAVYKGIDSLMQHHGQAHGMFSGDEWLSGTHPSQGVELCAVVEYMFSMEQLLRILGDGFFGDILEKVAFNALPAAISPAWDSHQYDQQVNQIMCNSAKRNWVNGAAANTFGLAPNFGCCTANMHQGWPKLASHLWMTSRDGGIAAVAYAPCSVTAAVGNGSKVQLDVVTEYPFKEHITITVSLDGAAAAPAASASQGPEANTAADAVTFPLYLRIPAWCKGAVIEINGAACPYQVKDGFARIERAWSDRDVIRLSLPMEASIVPRSNYAVSVERGPLVYVMPVAESWHNVNKRPRFSDWEVYPASPWKYGLLDSTPLQVQLELGEIGYQPFDASKGAPVRLLAKGQMLPQWEMEHHSAGHPPMQPALRSDLPIEDIELVPYGSARLRIGEFPVLIRR